MIEFRDYLIQLLVWLGIWQTVIQPQLPDPPKKPGGEAPPVWGNPDGLPHPPGGP